MKRVIAILSTLTLVAAIPALLAISVALAQPGGAATPAEYTGVILTIVVSALGCAACLLALFGGTRVRSAGGRAEMTAAQLLAGVGPLAILGALFAVEGSGYAPLVALLNLLDPLILWAVMCTLALAAPLFALTSSQGWRLASVARPAARIVRMD